MKKFDSNLYLTGHDLKYQWQKLCLIVCMLAVPFTIYAEADKSSAAEPTGNVAKNYQHWADVDAEWNGDILSAQKSDYFEGEVIPHVYVVEASKSTPLVQGQTYTMSVIMNYFQSNTNAGGFAHMTTYNISRSPGLLPNASGLAPTADAIFTGTGMEGVFYTVDADIVSVSNSVPGGSATKDQTVTITWTYTGTTTTTGIAEIYFGLYIAEPGQISDQGLGETDGASAWTGGSLQTTVNDAVFGGGALSIQLAPSAIIRGTISGLKYSDLNNNGDQDAGEPTLANWKIYLDLNNNGTWDDGEPSELTAADGTYSFSVIPDADRSDIDNDPYIVREVQQATYTQTEPVNPNYYSVIVTVASPVHTGKDFGNFICVNPEINTPATGAVCQGATSVSVSYGSVSGAPDQYSIDWNTAANTAGLVDIAYTALPTSPFTIAIPVNLAAATYTGTIYVRNSGTNCVSGGTQITLTINATPAAPGVAPVNYCVGATAAQLTATGSGLLWYDSPGDMTGSETAPTPNTAVAGTFTYYVTQTVNGCISPRATLVVTVTANAVVDAGSYGPICVGSSAITLGGSPAGGTWTGTGVSFDAQLSVYVFTPSTAGNFELTYTYPVPNGTTIICGGEDKTTIVVNALPAAPATAPVSYCVGETAVALTATGTGLLWYDGPDDMTGSATAPTPSTAAAGTTTYYVTQTVNGCESPRAALLVTIHANPTINAGVDRELTCEVKTVELTATTTGLAILTFNWTTEDGNIVSGGNTATAVVNAAGTYVVTVTNPTTGCTASDEVKVTQDNIVPEVSIRTNTAPVIKCGFRSIELIGSSRMEGVMFIWTGPDGFTSTDQNIFVTVGGVYTLTATNEETGCSGSASMTVYDISQAPDANAGPDKVITCNSPTVTLEANSADAENKPLGYIWTYEDGTLITSSRIATVDKPGVYHLKVIDIHSGCSNYDQVVVTLDKALPNISAQGGTLSCETGTLQLMGASTTAGVTYSWTGPGDYTSSAQNPSISVAGEYTLTVMNPENGCTASATVTVNPQPVVPQPEAVCYEINFEENETGFVNSTSTGAGVVNIFNYRRNVDGTYAGENHASIFDTANPTGDDLDLWTPDWGHVLIINQDLNPEPNDNPWGGEMTLDFSEIGPVTMTSLKALDFDVYEDNSWVYMYDGKGNELHKVQIQSLGNMSQQVIDLGNTKGVMYMRVVLDGFNEHDMLAGSGAIDDIRFCVETEGEGPCVTEEPTNEIQASAFPMPFSDRTTIEFTATESQDYVIQLFDAKGRMIRELKSGKAKAGEQVSVEVDASDLPNGLYIANIIGKTGIKKSVKLINRR